VSLKNTVLTCATAFLLGCSAGVPIAITNQSGRALQNVTISGHGFDQHLSSIRSGETATLYVHPAAESGVAIAFNMGGKKFTYAEDGYFEANGGYRVAIAVDAAGRAIVHTERANY
jgi:hypothetical protein